MNSLQREKTKAQVSVVPKMTVSLSVFCYTPKSKTEKKRKTRFKGHDLTSTSKFQVVVSLSEVCSSPGVGEF